MYFQAHNVNHSSILQSMSYLNIGPRTYRYVAACLSSNRSVCLQLGTFKTNLFTLGNWGTPQGAVLSQFLFNITVILLAQELERIPSVNHSLYADDITIWVNAGNIVKSNQNCSWPWTLLTTPMALVSHAPRLNMNSLSLTERDGIALAFKSH